MEHSTKEKLTIKGTFWTAGDNVYIDIFQDGKWECLCLNDFMKKSINENDIITIDIEVQKRGNS